MTGGAVILFAVKGGRRGLSRCLESWRYETPAGPQEEEQTCASEQAVKSNRIAQAEEIAWRPVG
jgi:hypothetical protein